MFFFCSGLSYASAQTDGTSGVGKGDTSAPKPAPKNNNKEKPKNNTPRIKSQTPKTSPGGNTTRPKPGNNNQANETPREECAEGTLVIRCDLPECNVLVDSKSQGITNLNGELRIPTPRGKRNIVVSKNGYETAQAIATVSCGELEMVNLRLKAKPFDLQLKTNPPNADILINDPPQLKGKSDENGVFKFRVENDLILVQARKTGYQTASITVTPAAAQKEIQLVLKPIPARIILNTNVAGAFVLIDGDDKKHDLTESISLEPGRRKLTVAALGFKSQTLDLDLQPNQKVEKTISFDALPVAELINQAEQFLKSKSMPEALRLCEYVFKSEPNNPVANRLAGTIYLEKQDYARAEPYLLKALDGNESIALSVRRHHNEKFEMSGAHNACRGLLRLSRNAVEYQGLHVTTENFKVSYSQIQIAGLQIKKNVALFLSLKVTEAKGGRREYNFFGVDKEFSLEAKPYLEMIHRLLQRYKT
jgi:tetratricopeptide (TPR) repeat protein